jgi:hypothetical protein
MPDTEQVEMVEGDPAGTGDGYQWVVLANTTAAQFMSQLDGSIVIIALPAIFRGIGLDLPLPVHRDARCAVAHRLAGGPSPWRVHADRQLRRHPDRRVPSGEARVRARHEPGLRLRDQSGSRQGGRIDWWGNATFAVGLGVVLIGLTYGIQPYGHDSMGWTSPFVVGTLVSGAALLAAFIVIETKVAQPLFQLSLLRIRAFTAGSLAGFAVSIARGGLQFMLIIWLQGIWLSAALADAFRQHGLPVVLVNVTGAAPGRTDRRRSPGTISSQLGRPRR